MPRTYLYVVSCTIITSLFIIYLSMLDFSIASSSQELSNSILMNANSSSSNSSVGTLIQNMTSKESESSSAYGPNAGLLQVRYTGLIRSDISPEIAEWLGLNDTYPGVMVTEVIPGSPAEKSGIRGANMTRELDGEIVRLGGDIIVAVDGNASVAREDEMFIDYLQDEKDIGDNITLTFLRDGQVNETELTLDSLPNFFWYEDDDEGIRMKYPSDWRVSDRNLESNDVIKFFSPEENPEVGSSAAAVLVKVSAANGLTLDEIALQQEEGSGNTRVLDLKGTELSGLQAYETIYYEYGANRTLKVKSTFTVNDDQIYFINYAADASKYDDYLPMVEETLKSFQFTKS